ncbi:MAG: hypothetical protein NTW32_03815 [Chloroflexi bacterium]|nr:hypothetical protein [Chloroflexota bacterium]
MRKLTFLLLGITLILSGCASPSSTTPLGSVDELTAGQPAAAGTAADTATIVWFPATTTWTPAPTFVPSATPQLLPGLGPQLYKDDFNDLKTWSFSKSQASEGNNIILDRNRLTLAINLSPATLFSLNNDLLLTNFQSEMTVSINRCFGPDVYGILFHAASGTYAYRFLLNCTGKARVELVRDGTTIPLQEWVPSGDAPSGAPGLVKMGVWVAGTEMRFFLNDHYQFTVFNPVFKSGSLGVFANASSPDGLNISFSKLTVHSVDYASPTPTATPTRTRTPTRTPRPTP